MMTSYRPIKLQISEKCCHYISSNPLSNLHGMDEQIDLLTPFILHELSAEETGQNC